MLNPFVLLLFSPKEQQYRVLSDTEVFLIFSIAIRYDYKRAGCLLSQNVRFPLCQPWTWAHLLIRGVWVAGLLLYISHVPFSAHFQILIPLYFEIETFCWKDAKCRPCPLLLPLFVALSYLNLLAGPWPSSFDTVEVPIDESVLIYLSFTLSKLQTCFSGEFLITLNSNYSTWYLIFVLLSTITIPWLKS